MNVYEIESCGIELRVQGDKLAVAGPPDILTDDRIELLRRHKQELIDQVLLRRFCDLVRAYGTDHQVLLSDTEIARELDADDIHELRGLDVMEKQNWAQMLAYRLTKDWTAADRRPNETVH